jgi:hypothetical protein
MEALRGPKGIEDKRLSCGVDFQREIVTSSSIIPLVGRRTFAQGTVSRLLVRYRFSPSMSQSSTTTIGCRILDPERRIVTSACTMASTASINNLFITTPNAIYLHTDPEKRLLFECTTSDGIVNAKASKDNSGLLAIADSQLVILHDSMRGGNREYKLKSGDVGPLAFGLLTLHGLTDNTGRAKTPPLLARLTRSLLHYNAQFRHPSVLGYDN